MDPSYLSDKKTYENKAQHFLFSANVMASGFFMRSDCCYLTTACSVIHTFKHSYITSVYLMNPPTQRSLNISWALVVKKTMSVHLSSEKSNCLCICHVYHFLYNSRGNKKRNVQTIHSQRMLVLTVIIVEGTYHILYKKLDLDVEVCRDFKN